MCISLHLARDNITLHFLKSRNNNRLLNAVGIGTTFIDVFTASLFISLNIGLTSKASKMYGTHNFKQVGIYFHRSLIVNFITLIPGCLLSYYSDKVLIFLKFDYQTSIYVHEYLSQSIFGLFAFMLFNTQVATLYACHNFYIPAMIEILGCVVYWILAYFLIVVKNMDMTGVAICFNVLYTVSAIALFIYQLVMVPVPGTLFWFKAESFKELWSHFTSEIKIGSVVFLEWIADEIVYMFGGVLSVNEVTALTIAYTNLFVLESIPLSLMDTLLAYMGHAMGENNPQKAKKFLKTGLIVSTVGLIIIEVIFMLLPEDIIKFYTNDPAIVDLSTKILRITLLGYLSDFSKNILMAGLTAIGKEGVASKITLICYYLVEIPLSYCLCFFAGLNAVGLALGQAITPYIILAAVLVVYWRLNWKHQANIVSEEVDNMNNYSFVLDSNSPLKQTSIEWY